MTILLRKLQAPKLWYEAARAADAGNTPGTDALREFIPREFDQNGVSLFEVANNDEAKVIAAAFSFSQERIEHIVFAWVDRTALESDGIAINSTPGSTKHRFADICHRQVLVKTPEELIALTRVFAKGQIYSFEKPTIAAEARKSARSNQFDYSTIHKTSFSINWPARHLINFVGEKVVAVAGAPEPAA